MPRRLHGFTVAILVADHFEAVELTRPREALEREGARVTVVSERHGTLQGVNHVEPGEPVAVEATFAESSPDGFSAVVLPGGAVNADRLHALPAAQEFIRVIVDEGKPLAVICHGARLLVSAGVVAGRTLTSSPALKDDIRNAGGIWVDREVVVDGEWVSSRKPDDIPAFNREMLDLFEMHLGRWQRPAAGEPDECAAQGN